MRIVFSDGHYLAKQTALDRLVALKIVRSHSDEARLLARLDHEHIVKVYSEFPVPMEGQNFRFICMQYVQGSSLEKILQERRTSDPSEKLERSLNLCLKLARSLGAALAYAHAHQVFHLDVKPSNVIISETGHVYLSDFGVSLRANDVRDCQTVPLQFGGTMDYMSPEQKHVFSNCTPEAVRCVGAESDIYSLGVVLNEALTGSRDREILLSAEVVTAYPLSLLDFLKKCLEPQKEKRFQSAAELVRCIQSIDQYCNLRHRFQNFEKFEQPIARFFVVIMAAMPLFANGLGSVLNISYNSLRITHGLSAGQQFAFAVSVIVYNLVLYPAGCFLYIQRTRRIQQHWLKSNSSDTLKAFALLYKHVSWLLLLTSFCWLPGIIVFPLVLENTGPAPLAHFTLHFTLSIALSWLIAFVYSGFFIDAFVANVLFSLRLRRFPQISSSVENLLVPLRERMNLYSIGAGLIPLSAAAILMTVFSGQGDLAQSELFRFLLLGLIVISMLGLGLTLWINRRTDRLIFLVQKLSSTL